MTPEQEAAIRQGHAAGRSQNSIARELDIPAWTISRWSKSAGLLWTGAPAGAEQQSERIRAGRRQMAEAAIADALALRERLWDNDTPDARAIRDLTAALESLVRTHLALDSAVSDGRVEAARSMLRTLEINVRALVGEEPGEVPSAVPARTPAGSRRGGY